MCVCERERGRERGREGEGEREREREKERDPAMLLQQINDLFLVYVQELLKCME